MNVFKGDVMGTTNFAIASEPFVDFDTSGWSQPNRENLTGALNNLSGVTSVSYAGAGNTTRVRYNPHVTDRSILIDLATEAADRILPEYKFNER
ncbi:hypothetical protein ACNI3Q_11450 [Sphingomonas sp. FW199]|uniref:hypothetical protein n=1 Tax=Sphingomonas sp. FW199 TaxID=3400217 RepID=UPI003CEA1DAA